MKKVVINKCWGGFGLSDEAVELYGKLSGLDLIKYNDPDVPRMVSCGSTYFFDEIDDGNFFDESEIERDDPNLVRVVELLGEKASAQLSKLKIVEIPEDVHFTIGEYDGQEWVAEKHRTWH